MTELDDNDLLAEYVRNGSEAAFAALVSRYVNLVHCAAIRFTSNPNHAEEITQAVFVILAKKSRGLRRGVILSGWLGGPIQTDGQVPAYVRIARDCATVPQLVYIAAGYGLSSRCSHNRRYLIPLHQLRSADRSKRPFSSLLSG